MSMVVLVVAVNSAAITDRTIDELVAKIMANRQEGEVALDKAVPDDETLFGEREVSEETAKKQVKSFNINMCFYCDDNCITKLASANIEHGAYYDDIASRVQDMLNTLDPSKYSFTTAALYKLTPGVSIPYLYFKSRADHSTGSVLLANVNENFWNYNNLYAYSVTMGCNADILTVSPDDSLWASNYVGGIDGIANMMAVCTKYSYSTVKINTNPTRMAALVGHELGHLLGMFHDGAAEDYPEATCDYFEGFNPTLGAPCRAVAEQCTAASHGCADGPNNCLMSASVGTETKYSACSAAYFEIYQRTAEIMQDENSYSMLCIQQSKRALREEVEPLADENNFKLPPLGNKRVIRLVENVESQGDENNFKLAPLGK